MTTGNEAPAFGGIFEPPASPLVRGEGVAAWRRIADEIEADIATQRLAPGTQLPTEAQLSARFGVNRHTVRRALAALAERGLLRANQGRGTFVENRPLSYPIGPRTRFSENILREHLEPGGEFLGAEEIPATPLVARALSVVAASPVLAVRSRRFADATPVSCGVMYMPLPRFAAFVDTYRSHLAVTPALAACGVADYRRLETRISARTATGEEAAHLNLAPGRLVITATGVDVCVDGVPILLAQTAFAADRVELVVSSDDQC
ncbi:GntR family phosphonate transport system transcriptional regulator [Pseudochelatococcus lubricantis]|uniref:GntR family phosphonate transport system transcriptional regulator n=1 Tax=Pseudochelatococcus lubricantis TaxID=1538102 RepID=A0ABX0UZW5_9HYPH|nr:phosphonate metabolism transcriptional regulator PhnF [Pseudochelatococcus lubricantis]NIJ58502.1 GntR family phosphonate transport system transcriptional regulator [Pseudochelatococcus lubricantis]